MARYKPETDKIDITRKNPYISYVYSDWDINFTPHPTVNDITIKYDVESVKQSIKNLIFTSRGERPFQPNLGSNLRKLLFEPVDPFTSLDLKEAIKETITNFEPRVNLIDIIVNPDPDNHTYMVEIKFQVILTMQYGDVSLLLEKIR